MRSTVSVLCAALAMIAVPGAATASTAGWELSLLPLPAGHEKATGYVTGTAGRGEYSGFIGVGDGAQVVTWTDERPTLRGTPAGTEFAATSDQNEDGTIIGSAVDYDTGVSELFVLDDTGFRSLPVPEGYRDGYVTAINARGDIIGGAFRGSEVVVLWPAGELDKPRVLEVGLPSANAADIDDDGTVLIYNDAGQYVWQDGRLTRLESPAGYSNTNVRAIKNGLVVGSAAGPTLPNRTGLVWCNVTLPTPCQSVRPNALPRSEAATEINGSELIVGSELTAEIRGPLAVWQGLEYLGRLPVPEGEQGAAGAVAEDGTITGWVTSGDPSDGGHPAVWLPIW